jgi:hypothetical protein
MSEAKEVPMTVAEAVALARALCEERGWPWLEPVAVKEKRKEWVVTTNAAARGANARFRIRRHDGQVTEAVFMAR